MIWSDWGSQDRIEIATLAGLDRRYLVETDVIDPKGLAIDYANERSV